MANTELRQLSIDLNRGKPQGNFSLEDGNKMIRGAILEACGGKLDRYTMRDNMGAIFGIVAEVMTPGLGELISGKFDEFADVKVLELGDRLEIDIKDNSLFRVASVAPGNRDIRRQKIYNKKLVVETEKLAIKIYEDLDRFLAGRIDWVELTNRVQESYLAEISKRIYDAIYEAYNDLEAPFQVSGSFDEDVFIETVAHVKASTGQECGVYGTAKALSKIKTDANYLSDNMKEQLNTTGYIGTYRGTPLFELPQGHKAGTTEFIVSDDFLLVLPIGEKIVKVVLEGDVVVDDRGDGSADARNDEQLEFFLGRKVGVAVLKANMFAIYRLDEESTNKDKFGDLVEAVEKEKAPVEPGE